MAVIVNGDGILTGISSLATALTDLTSGRGTVTGVATVGTLQLGAGVSISSPRTQQAAIFTNNTEFFTVDDAGRVGVGTITPNSDAHPENEKKIKPEETRTIDLPHIFDQKQFLKLAFLFFLSVQMTY